MMNKIELFLKELRESSDRINNIFTNGACVRLFSMLKILFPNAELYWSDRDVHGVTKIDGVYYDIGGIVCSDYLIMKEYHLIPPENYAGYKLLKHTEEDVKLSVTVEKYFK